MPHAMFRPRRLREKGLLRRLVRETALGVNDLVYPMFAVHGRSVREPIGSMPGQFRLSIDELMREAKDVAGLGIPAVLMFGLPEDKDARGSEAYADDGIVQQAVRAVDLVFHAAGTNAVYERNPLERHFRDIHVAVQHAAGLPAHMEAAGKALLGLRPTDPGW